MNPSDKIIPVFKPKTPVGLILGVVGGCLLLLVGIFYAIATMKTDFDRARMTGLIVEKNFTPEPQQEISLGSSGLQARSVEGEFTLTVNVPQQDGTNREFRVWVPKEIYDAVQVGGEFDVGPYLVPDGS
jgi:hypothetical protein